MAALSANPSVPQKAETRSKTRAAIVSEDEVIYDSAFVGYDSNGDLVAWSDTSGLRWAGISEKGSVTGDQTVTPKKDAEVRRDGPVLVGVSVTSVNDEDDIGKVVYCATDNPADMTLAPTDLVGPIGRVIDYRSASDVDVELFTQAEAYAVTSRGTMSFHVNLATITTAGDVVTTITPGFRGRLKKWYFVTGTPVTTAAKAATLNLEVGTTNVTGGTIALTSAAATPLGATIAQGSAFTAGTAFDDTDTISIEAASVTAFAEGDGMIVIHYEADE